GAPRDGDLGRGPCERGDGKPAVERLQVHARRRTGGAPCAAAGAPRHARSKRQRRRNPGVAATACVPEVLPGRQPGSGGDQGHRPGARYRTRDSGSTRWRDICGEHAWNRNGIHTPAPGGGCANAAQDHAGFLTEGEGGVRMMRPMLVAGILVLSAACARQEASPEPEPTPARTDWIYTRRTVERLVLEARYAEADSVLASFQVREG